VIGRVAGCVALIFLLAGCAGLLPSSEEARYPTSAYQNSIDIDGRLSVQYQQNGSNEALHGSFSWSQTAQKIVVTLSSPLGQTLARIDVTPTMSSLTESGQPTRIAADPDALTERALGWPLPIAGMRDWLQGVAINANGQRVVASDKSDEASTVVTQDNWHIRYASWQDTDTIPLSSHPRRIDMTRNTQEAGEVSIRLVIDNWQPR
jgi:outer membrane lipoprotein LolB